jgi:hypothetical protein
MSYRVLTEIEWETLEAAERGLYPQGLHAYTDVRDRMDSEALAAMWDDAYSAVETAGDDVLADDGSEPEDAIRAEVARRVAAAQHVLMLGEAPSVRVHRFASTGQAYNASQCRDEIRPGDVLVVEPEGVVGILISAWPTAITERTGEFHSLDETADVADLVPADSFRVARAIAGERSRS